MFRNFFVLAAVALAVTSCGSSRRTGGNVYGMSEGSITRREAAVLLVTQPEILVRRVDMSDRPLEELHAVYNNGDVFLPLTGLYHIYLLPGRKPRWEVKWVEVRVGNYATGLNTFPIRWRGGSVTPFLFKAAQRGHVPTGGRWFHEIRGDQQMSFRVQYWNSRTEEVGPLVEVPNEGASRIYLIGG